VVPSSYVKKRVGIYTGKYYHSINIHRFMVGRRFGEFAVTKRLGPSIHIKQKKGKKQRSKK
jgi:ribosomal protein S19